MIYTITCNPAIDRTVLVQDINQKDVTRVQKTIRTAAGKGINSSKVIKQLEHESIALGFIAGENGLFIEKQLSDMNVKHRFIPVIGETRENIKIVSPCTVLEFNEVGPLVKEHHMEELKRFVGLLNKNDVLVIGGSVSQGVKVELYQEIIDLARQNDVITICDTSGKLFDSAIKAKPTIIKPNKYELEQYFDKSYTHNDDVIKDAVRLVNTGIEMVFVSLGKEGAVLCTNKGVYQAILPEVEAKNTVGAGDSFIAGIAVALINNKREEEILRYASSVATASVLSEETGNVNKSDVLTLLEQIEIKKIEV